MQIVGARDTPDTQWTRTATFRWRACCMALNVDSKCGVMICRTESCLAAGGRQIRMARASSRTR